MAHDKLAYDRAWRKKRREAGLPYAGARYWDPVKMAARNLRYYSDPVVRARKAELARAYLKDPKLRKKEEARWRARQAVASGRLVRGSCEVCGEVKVHGHHDDYDKPLDVRWLCRPHHEKLHKELRKAQSEMKGEGKL